MRSRRFGRRGAVRAGPPRRAEARPLGCWVGHAGAPVGRRQRAASRHGGLLRRAAPPAPVLRPPWLGTACEDPLRLWWRRGRRFCSPGPPALSPSARALARRAPASARANQPYPYCSVADGRPARGGRAARPVWTTRQGGAAEPLRPLPGPQARAGPPPAPGRDTARAAPARIAITVQFQMHAARPHSGRSRAPRCVCGGAAAARARLASCVISRPTGCPRATRARPPTTCPCHSPLRIGEHSHPPVLAHASRAYHAHARATPRCLWRDPACGPGPPPHERGRSGGARPPPPGAVVGQAAGAGRAACIRQALALPPPFAPSCLSLSLHPMTRPHRRPNLLGRGMRLPPSACKPLL